MSVSNFVESRRRKSFAASSSSDTGIRKSGGKSSAGKNDKEAPGKKDDAKTVGKLPRLSTRLQKLSDVLANPGEPKAKKERSTPKIQKSLKGKELVRMLAFDSDSELLNRSGSRGRADSSLSDPDVAGPPPPAYIPQGPLDDLIERKAPASRVEQRPGSKKEKKSGKARASSKSRSRGIDSVESSSASEHATTVARRTSAGIHWPPPVTTAQMAFGAATGRATASGGARTGGTTTATTTTTTAGKDFAGEENRKGATVCTEPLLTSRGRASQSYGDDIMDPSSRSDGTEEMRNLLDEIAVGQAASEHRTARGFVELHEVNVNLLQEEWRRLNVDVVLALRREVDENHKPLSRQEKFNRYVAYVNNPEQWKIDEHTQRLVSLSSETGLKASSRGNMKGGLKISNPGGVLAAARSRIERSTDTPMSPRSGQRGFKSGQASEQAASSPLRPLSMAANAAPGEPEKLQIRLTDIPNTTLRQIGARNLSGLVQRFIYLQRLERGVPLRSPIYRANGDPLDVRSPEGALGALPDKEMTPERREEMAQIRKLLIRNFQDRFQASQVVPEFDRLMAEMYARNLGITVTGDFRNPATIQTETVLDDSAMHGGYGFPALQFKMRIEGTEGQATDLSMESFKVALGNMMIPHEIISALYLFIYGYMSMEIDDPDRTQRDPNDNGFTLATGLLYRDALLPLLRKSGNPFKPATPEHRLYSWLKDHFLDHLANAFAIGSQNLFESIQWYYIDNRLTLAQQQLLKESATPLLSDVYRQMLEQNETEAHMLTAESIERNAYPALEHLPEFDRSLPWESIPVPFPDTGLTVQLKNSGVASLPPAEPTPQYEAPSSPPPPPPPPPPPRLHHHGWRR